MIVLRKVKGLTQEQVAEKLGRPQSFVAKYEGGERRLDAIEFLDVTAALDTDPCEILSSLRS
ncbi:MAG: helix-turn-helix transcriptional regulator [Mesorhizobium sp.]|nr:MAG: XRE family transcriptional regulator [Mesorhizobium sp.]TIS78295.1 MAG: helix-turn-helix transcriptional regulator [Mesorhizobium sp.]TIV72933.1 MAG: helix-turn-helix transcriptional regulator [Mesorhizobium sp.]